MLSFLKNLLSAAHPAPSNEKYHSKFGGLWIDRTDASEELERRIAADRVPPALGEKIAAFIENGFIILQGAVSKEHVDRLAAVVRDGYTNGDTRLRYHTDGKEHLVLKPNTDPAGKRIVESQAVLPEIRNVLSAPAILEFLNAVFDEPPVLTQSLVFQEGSQQDFHQDTAFVVYNEPLKFAASWVALEDIEEGSGELRYLVKSHRLPDYSFSHNRKDSHGLPPGELDRYLSWLEAESKRLGLEERRFLASKGDALIWHADLAHGGSPITRDGSTRQSVVGHYCPVSVFPKYERARKRSRHGELQYSTYLYDLNELG